MRVGITCKGRSSTTWPPPVIPPKPSPTSSAPTSTSITSAGTPAWSTESGCRRSPTRAYLFVDTEHEHWKTTESLFAGDDVFGDSVAPISAAGLADLVVTDHRVCDEVHFQPTPGHTPGHISVVIESDGAKAIITGDMTHNPLQIADPDLSSMFDTDQDAARATRRAVFPDWADGKTLVIGTHFGSPTAGFMHPEGDGYRLEV